LGSFSLFEEEEEEMRMSLSQLGRRKELLGKESIPVGRLSDRFVLHGIHFDLRSRTTLTVPASMVPLSAWKFI